MDTAIFYITSHFYKCSESVYLNIFFIDVQLAGKISVNLIVKINDLRAFFPYTFYSQGVDSFAFHLLSV